MIYREFSTFLPFPSSFLCFPPSFLFFPFSVLIILLPPQPIFSSALPILFFQSNVFIATFLLLCFSSLCPGQSITSSHSMVLLRVDKNCFDRKCRLFPCIYKLLTAVTTHSSGTLCSEYKNYSCYNEV